MLQPHSESKLADFFDTNAMHTSCVGMFTAASLQLA